MEGPKPPRQQLKEESEGETLLAQQFKRGSQQPDTVRKEKSQLDKAEGRITAC